MKYGRRTPKNAPAIKFRSIYKGSVPPHLQQADYLNIGGWQMLGNDQYGDCVAVTWANVRRLMSHQAGGSEYPNLAQVEAFYKTQNPNFPNEDNGMDIQTALEYLVKTGGPDGAKALAFAKVDVTDLDEVKAALSIFGFLWTGINVQDANMTQFNQNQPWDYVSGSANDGGHSIISGGFDSDNQGADVRFVTWAQETGFTDNFWHHQTEEAWVVIWPEHLTSPAFQAGIDQQALADAYLQITGRPFPNNPAPSPEPTPVPDPTPVDVDQALLGVAQSWLTKKRHNAGQNAALRSALQNWVDARS